MPNIYDDQNIFAKILRGEIPSKKVYEDDMILAFHDAFPTAPVHVLVIPKGEYVNFADFVNNAPSDTKEHFFIKITEIAESLNLEKGYRILANTGSSAGQTVFHFHMHIMGGF